MEKTWKINTQQKYNTHFPPLSLSFLPFKVNDGNVYILNETFFGCRKNLNMENGGKRAVCDVMMMNEHQERNFLGSCKFSLDEN